MSSNLNKSTSTFPPPPPWYELYNSQNSHPPPPPLPPVDGKCMSFASQVSVNSSFTLKDFGVEELFESESVEAIPSELKKLNKLLFQNFTQLLDSSQLSDSFIQQTIGKIEIIFVNMHYLLNALRPAQAVERVIDIQKDRLAYRKNIIQILRQKINKSAEVLQKLESGEKM